MSHSSFTAEMKEAAERLGFQLVGATPAVSPTGVHRLGEWLAAGYGGQMRWIADRQAAYAHPRHVLEGVRSLLLLGAVYRTAEPVAAQPGEGRVSRYAWGSDYHDLLHGRLRQLVELHRRLRPELAVRGVVDTAPLLEREFAQLAGLGWIGKNTLLLNRQWGSWFFLSVLLSEAELEYDAPHEADHCGTCRACLDACPTGAFVAPYVLDARRCISYLTIELRDAVPHHLREGVGDWVFGCDVCQDVCPWNHRAPAVDEQALSPRALSNPLPLIQLFELDDAAFRHRFRDTPLWRAKRRGMLRSAALVLGNQQPREAIGALVRGLNDAEPLVRGACAWALGRYAAVPCRAALLERQQIETNADVLDEIARALDHDSCATAP